MSRGKAYCICGGSRLIVGPPKAVEEVLREFWERHSGEGHGPCDAKTAAKARRKAEEETIRNAR